MTAPPITPEVVARLPVCTCGEVYGEDPNCPKHGRGTVWGKANPDICALAEKAADYDALLSAHTAQAAERDEAREIVAKCNNSLFGSYGYFTHASGKTAPEAIENLKADNVRYWRENTEQAAHIKALEEALRPLIELYGNFAPGRPWQLPDDHPIVAARSAKPGATSPGAGGDMLWRNPAPNASPVRGPSGRFVTLGPDGIALTTPAADKQGGEGS